MYYVIYIFLFILWQFLKYYRNYSKYQNTVKSIEHHYLQYSLPFRVVVQNDELFDQLEDVSKDKIKYCKNSWKNKLNLVLYLLKGEQQSIDSQFSVYYIKSFVMKIW